MELEELRELLLAMPGCREGQPFGPDTLVYKVGGKMFALTGLEHVVCRVNLKCDPERAIELRERYPETVLPGYHMNKTHWNTVLLDGSLPGARVEELIRHSWELVVAGLSRRARRQAGL